MRWMASYEVTSSDRSNPTRRRHLIAIERHGVSVGDSRDLGEQIAHSTRRNALGYRSVDKGRCRAGTLIAVRMSDVAEIVGSTCGLPE